MRLHVETVGSGPPLVLLHGWGLHGGLFAPLLSRLYDRFTLYNVDLPGHGHSPACEPFDVPTLLAALRAATQSIAAPLNVLGWSFGGMLAQAWALSEPARIARLILHCTKPRFVQSDDWPLGTPPEVLQSFVNGFSQAPEETMRRFLTLNVVGTENAKKILTQIRAHAASRPHVQTVALRQGLELLRTFDVRAQVSALAMPTLVITGGLDRLTHPDVGQWYAENVPTAQRFHLPRAAHAPHVSHPDETAAAIAAFLAA